MSLFILPLQKLTMLHHIKNDDIIVVLAGNFSGGFGFLIY